MTDQTPIDVPSREVEVVDGPTVADLTPARVEPGTLVRPAAEPDDVVAAFTEYVALRDRILIDADYQGIQGKRFTKRSGYRKLAAAFAVSYTIVDRTIDRDETGKVTYAEFVVRATAPNGRSVDGWGACSRDERQFSKPNHDIPATAETRAKNRASADLFGMGEVSAEEVDRSDPDARWADEGEFRAVVDAARRLKEAGGNPGKYPVVLGVPMLTDDGNIGITASQAAELVERLERERANMRAQAALNDKTVGADAEPVPLPADDASAPTPSAENGDQDGAALSLLDGTAVPAPDESGVGEAGGAPVPARGSQSPAPGGEPMNPGLRNRLGAYSSDLGLDRDTKLAIYTFICQRPIASGNEMTKNEGEWAATALRLMKNGHLAWDADTAQIGAIDPTDGMADDPTRLPGVKFMQDFAALHGFEYDLGETTDQEA